MNILLTCVGRRKYLVDYFNTELHKHGMGHTVGTDMTTTAPGLTSCDRQYQVGAVDSSTYIDELAAVCETEDIAALVSLNDVEIPILAKHTQRFEELGVQLVVSNQRAVEICSDKWLTSQFAADLGINTPRTFKSLASAEQALDNCEISYPLIVKPRWGSASFGISTVQSTEDLRAQFRQCAAAITDSHLSTYSKSNNNVIVQQLLEGTEYGLDIFADMTGSFHGVVCKQKLSMRGGETDKAISVPPHRFEPMARKIALGLKHVGNLDCDVFENEAGLHLLELNPRFGGGYPFSHESGANLVRSLIHSLAGDHHLVDTSYAAGKSYAKCDQLVSLDASSLRDPSKSSGRLR